MQPSGRGYSYHGLTLATLLIAVSACGSDKAADPSTISNSTDGPRERDDVGNAGTTGNDASSQPTHTGTTGGRNAPPGTPDHSYCRPANSSEQMPALHQTMAVGDSSGRRLVLVRDLVNLYKSPCASCHPGLLDGASDSWPDKSQPDPWWTRGHAKDIMARITTDSEMDVMPPYDQYHLHWSDHDQPGDPIRALKELLEAWFASGDGGDPRTDVFYVPVASDASTATSSYMMSEAVGEALTNIGNCIPDKTTFATYSSVMDSLDKFWESATELPLTLDQTDLTSYDSEALARSGLVAFAPAYPLFSDDAQKIRYVRVPRGQSIRFNKDTQEFTIPDNTRFYKTFFKKVIQSDGTERYRKIETRLIVARQDGPDAGDGSHETKVLYGTYVWDDTETSATLERDPLRNGKPFLDRLITYVTDEQKANAALASPIRNKDSALFEAGASRTYAVPSAVRCVQCHMGSHTRSFSLGFTPLQIKRRHTGEGGTYEPTSDDEYAQLQRLIDLGVITGIDSLDDVLPLEQSQGDRKPRTPQELNAQGYMLGNCGGCHNPRGYPTVQNPVLANVLRFFPDRDGGIFEFPIDRVSPRTRRGINQDVNIPYITPSLVEMENADAINNNTAGEWQRVPIVELGGVDPDPDVKKTTYYVAAPWRSLIYRNVDTPFMYGQDYALHPHMPMNAVGFDARAPKIMAEWMISLPARLKQGEASPDGVQEHWERLTTNQPYEEVHEGDSDYQTAVADANKRLSLYHDGGPAPIDYFKAAGHDTTVFLNYRYAKYSPDTRDTIDHDLLSVTAKTTVPDDVSLLPNMPDLQTEMEPDPKTASLDDKLMYVAGTTRDGVPDRPNWVVTDITDVPPPWSPRRIDWADILVSHLDDATNSMDQRAAQKIVLGVLSNLTLTPGFRTFAQTSIPLGLWIDKDGCDFDKLGIRKVSSFTGADRWDWMDLPSTPADGHVFMDTVGGAVFNEICVNCHGPNYDSRGRQADNLMQITGGTVRVANFRDGLFGPADQPGSNVDRVFGPYVGQLPGFTSDDLAAQYMAWMALGGTKASIDKLILALVGNATVLGTARKNAGAGVAADANMLSNAKSYCGLTELTLHTANPGDLTFAQATRPVSSVVPALISTNGDEEMWRRVCEFENPRPILVAKVSAGVMGSANALIFYGYFDPKGYPADGYVMDENGDQQTTLKPDNHLPWCVLEPANSEERAAYGQLVKDQRNGKPLARCPAASSGAGGWPMTRMNDDDIKSWETHGAINAGFSVFTYLKQRALDAKAGKPAPVTYDQCQEYKQ